MKMVLYISRMSLILRKHKLIYLGIKRHDACNLLNLLLNGFAQKKKNYVNTYIQSKHSKTLLSGLGRVGGRKKGRHTRVKGQGSSAGSERHNIV